VCPIKIMNKFKNITISLITAAFTILLILGSYSTFASNDEYWSDFEDSENFMSAKNDYHKSMNNFFNEKFESIYNLMEDKDFFTENNPTRALLSPPADEVIKECFNKDAVNESKMDKDKLEDDEFFSCILKDNACGTSNLSTYCVSMQASQIYFKYIDKLDEIQAELTNTNDTDCFYRQTIPVIGVQPTCVNTASLANLAGGIKERNEAIKAEYNSAKQIMEVTISAYNEFMLAYPMHKKYVSMLKSLTNYKNAFKALSRESLKFPLKFIGTSSYTCS